MLKIPITQIVSKNCGGHGAWLDNPLNTPSPGNNIWPGFQIGGDKQKMKKMRKTRKTRKTRQIRKRRMSRNTKKHQSKFR
jgi:hypothetical protein